MRARLHGKQSAAARQQQQKWNEMMFTENSIEMPSREIPVGRRRSGARRHSRNGAAPAMSIPVGCSGTALQRSNGQMIFNEGDEARHYYKVVTGRVRLYKMRADGRRQIVEFLIPGDVFGLECGTEHTLIAEAIGRTALERYPYGQIERLGDEQPDVGHRMMTMLQRNLSAVRHHMVMLGQDTAKERVAAFLALLAARFGMTGSGVLDLGMGRQDIADYVGLALETVCRELTTLEHDGLIEVMDHRQVAISNLTALQSLADGQSALLLR